MNTDNTENGQIVADPMVNTGLPLPESVWKEIRKRAIDLDTTAPRLIRDVLAWWLDRSGDPEALGYYKGSGKPSS